MDLGRRGGRAERAERGSADQGHRLAGHAGRGRRRRAGDDRAARPGDRRQSADRGADARLRHPRLGRAAGRGRRPQRHRQGRRLGRGRAGGGAVLLELRRRLDRGAGQRALDQLDLGEQEDLRRARAVRTDHLGRADRHARQDQGGRARPARPRRPGLAGRHDLRCGGQLDRRHRVLQGGAGRPRPRGARLGHHEGGVRPHGQAAHLRRRQLLRARLEPRHRDGDRGQGRHADDGRLGQGRVHQRRPDPRRGLPLLPPSRAPRAR